MHEMGKKFLSPRVPGGIETMQAKCLLLVRVRKGIATWRLSSKVEKMRTL